MSKRRWIIRTLHNGKKVDGYCPTRFDASCAIQSLAAIGIKAWLVGRETQRKR